MKRVVGLGLALVAIAWGAPGGGQPLGGAFAANTLHRPGCRPRRRWPSPRAATSSSSGRASARTATTSASSASATAAPGATQGAEFRVNDYTIGPQGAPAVAVGADGGFVVVWQGYGEGGDYQDIFARRYDSAGGSRRRRVPGQHRAGAARGGGGGHRPGQRLRHRLGRLRQTSSRGATTAPAPRSAASSRSTSRRSGFQGSADVAATPDGGFVVAWEEATSTRRGERRRWLRRLRAPLRRQRRRRSAASSRSTRPRVGDQYGVALAPRRRRRVRRRLAELSATPAPTTPCSGGASTRSARRRRATFASTGRRSSTPTRPTSAPTRPATSSSCGARPRPPAP